MFTLVRDWHVLPLSLHTLIFPSYRSSVVHQLVVMDPQFSRRIWGYLDWQGS